MNTTFGAIKPAERTHCHWCGGRFPDIENRFVSRRCEKCGNDNWVNPPPVAVLIIPTEGGVYAVRRGIEPRKGFVGLPAGFIENGEDWHDAAAREAWEELRVHVPSPRESIGHFETKSTPSGTQVLIFGIVKPGAQVIEHPFEPNHEALERLVINHRFSEEFAFPLHKLMIERYLTR